MGTSSQDENPDLYAETDMVLVKGLGMGEGLIPSEPAEKTILAVEKWTY